MSGVRQYDRADQRSVGELFGQLSQDVALLVRQEGQLAKSELQAKISRLTTDLISLATGGIVALIGALSLAAAVILLLIDPVGLDPWLAALIVGVVLGGIGYFMLQKGLRDMKEIDPTPQRTVESLKEDIQLAREARP
jgi:uncharacterized membrane protein YqjE